MNLGFSFLRKLALNFEEETRHKSLGSFRYVEKQAYVFHSAKQRQNKKVMAYIAKPEA